MFTDMLIKRKDELSEMNALDYSTLILFSCKAHITEESRSVLLEEMIPLIPVHISKIGPKGFGSLCYALSLVPKNNLSKELYAFLEVEY